MSGSEGGARKRTKDPRRTPNGLRRIGPFPGEATRPAPTLLDKQTRQILACHIGDRSRDSAKQLWAKIPARYRERATFYTDQYAAYIGVIPAAQHKAVTKHARQTNYIERFNNTLRQRVSRLVRSTLAFSKNVENHLGAIRYFICHYNLTRAALPV